MVKILFKDIGFKKYTLYFKNNVHGVKVLTWKFLYQIPKGRYFTKNAIQPMENSTSLIPGWGVADIGLLCFVCLNGDIRMLILKQKEEIISSAAAAAAAKSLQSWPTLCNPTEGSPPSFPVPGILQARTLEWVAISFSNAWKWKWKWNCSVVSDSERPHGSSNRT